MMEEDDSFELKEKKRIYFSKETEENAEENTDETAEDKAPTYDMRITFEDGTSADVHGIVLEDLRTLTIREKDIAAVMTTVVVKMVAMDVLIMVS